MEIQDILSLPVVPLPSIMKVGHGAAEWYENEDGFVEIHTSGQMVDRQYARELLVDALLYHGYRLATWVLPMPQENLSLSSSLQYVADWNDVMQKAKRISEAGGIMLLRNGSQYIVSQVQGDHGTYQVEIQRQDPNSRVITGWSCECQWSQYAFDRTRKWKKYESRPCSHVLATYWKSLGTPLDDADEMEQPMGTGQTQAPKSPPPADLAGPPGGHPPGGGGGEQPVGVREAPQGPRTFLPSGEMYGQGQEQGQLPLNMPQGPSPMSPTPRAPSRGVIPPFPGEQMALWENYQGPGTTPAGGESPPWAVAVPGATPPGPGNLMQQPGTYSKVAMEYGQQLQNGNPWRIGEPTGQAPNVRPYPDYLRQIQSSHDPSDEQYDDLYSGWSSTHDFDPRWDYYEDLKPHWQSHPLVQQAQARLDSHGAQGRVYAADLSSRDIVGLYASGTGADEPVMLVDPYQHERHTSSPQEASEQMTRTVDHEYRHALQDAEQGSEGPDYDEDDAEEWRPGTYSKVAAQYQNGQIVQLLEDEYGITEGPNGGTYQLVPARKPDGSPQTAEVISQDEATGWVEVIVPCDDSGPKMPYHMRLFMDPTQLKPSSQLPPGPMKRRVYK